MVSRMLALIGGQGNCPLIPTIGRETPSGAALTHPMLQVRATVFGAGGVMYGRADVDVELADPDAHVVEVVKLEIE